MENEFSTSNSMFNLSIDEGNRSNLAEAARWGRFLSILGFIMCGLIVLIGVFAGSFLAMFMSRPEFEDMESGAMPAGMGGLMLIIYIIIAVIYFFPCLFLFRFSNQMKAALASNDQEALNSSFQNLKSMFKYLGILAIIFLALYGIVFLIGLVGAAAFS